MDVLSPLSLPPSCRLDEGLSRLQRMVGPDVGRNWVLESPHEGSFLPIALGCYLGEIDFFLCLVTENLGFVTVN